MRKLFAILCFEIFCYIKFSVCDRSEQKKTNSVKKFIIFASARTGSNFIYELLGRHPDILMHHEVFGTEYNGVSTEANIPSGIVRKRFTDPNLFLNHMWTANGNKSTVGFKIFNYHLNISTAVQLLIKNTPDVKKIILYRSDLLASHTSDLIANKLKVWEGVHTSNVTIEVDPGYFNECKNKST